MDLRHHQFPVFNETWGTFELKMREETHVTDIKHQIFELLKIPPDSQILIAGRMILTDHMGWKDIQNTKCSHLVLVIRKRKTEEVTWSSTPFIHFEFEVQNVIFTCCQYPNDLVYNIKKKVSDKFQIPVKDQTISYGDVADLHNGRRLSYYFTGSIRSERPFTLSFSTIGPTSKYVQGSNAVRLFVKTLTGGTLVMDEISLATEILSFKILVWEKDGTPAESQRLIYSGKELENTRILSDYGIQAQSTIHMVLRLKGGS
ncbi:ubiquitin-related domain-containing protein [Ilyonectria destructans]|nr:ubiquitin-related domain-containing protein [Ilyonectria destructans]